MLPSNTAHQHLAAMFAALQVRVLDVLAESPQLLAELKDVESEYNK